MKFQNLATKLVSAASKSNKSIDSVKSDDSLTSLEWLSTMGNPTTPVLHSVYPPESQSYNIVDMISLAFRLSRKQVLSLTEISDMALRLAPHLSKVNSAERIQTCLNFMSLTSNVILTSNCRTPFFENCHRTVSSSRVRTVGVWHRLMFQVKQRSVKLTPIATSAGLVENQYQLSFHR